MELITYILQNVDEESNIEDLLKKDNFALWVKTKQDILIRSNINHMEIFSLSSRFPLHN